MIYLKDKTSQSVWQPVWQPVWRRFLLTSLLTGSALMGLSCTDSRPVPAADTQTDKSAAISGVTQTIVRNLLKSAYFGDLHVHTRNSFDAFIVGTRTSPDDAYKFAKGEPIDNGSGQTIRLSGPPLDFYAVTDHGEYLGVVAAMADRTNPISRTDTAGSIFGLAAGSAADRRQAFLQVGVTVVTGEAIEDIYDRDHIDSVWADSMAAAERHNAPGEFTTFSGYEFTSMQVVGDLNVDPNDVGALNLHRNVIFADSAPSRIFSTLDSPNPEDLWAWMGEQRAAGRDVISIPHNSNASNGQMFALTNYAGKPLSSELAQTRLNNEPIVEIVQIKGTSETHPLLSTEDEWAGHEIYDLLIGSTQASDVAPLSFTRKALAAGLGLEASIGINPYAFGFIGSSDTHVSGPSLSEEEHFGKFPSDTDLDVRGSVPPNGQSSWDRESDGRADTQFVRASQFAAAGLAGVWAEANTREDLFAAFRRKETFATSGPRIKVRMFAGDYALDILNQSDMIERAYAKGVAMGQVWSKRSESDAPAFLLWAVKDPEGMDLQRLQIIKVSYAQGEPQEAVIDVACAGGAMPDALTQRCPDNGASVDITTCETRSGTGASELKTVWRDDAHDPTVPVAYYLRVLENPKCRWSTWDAVRQGTPPNPDLEAVIQDRAWGSPIWIAPQP